VRRALAWAGIAAALAVVAAGAAVGQQRAREREASPWPSALSTGGRGLAAARMFLAATGRAPLRLESPGDRPPPRAVLLLAAPAAELEGAEADAIVAHARAGGTVVWMAGPVRQPALEQRLGVRARAAYGPRLATPLAPHPLVEGLALPVGSGSVEADDPVAFPVLGSGALVSAISIPAGAGEVLVLSGAEVLANERVGESGAASFLVRLAARGPVVFDERWLLPRDRPAPSSARALAAAALQALLAAGVWLAARARRLGAIRPPPAGGRGRTARDYLASLAGLYRRAGAEGELALATWRRARRALERRTGIPARLPGEDAASRLARRSAPAADALRRGETAVGSGRGALLATCRAADDLGRTLSRAAIPARRT
jgi:hypothetical protein